MTPRPDNAHEHEIRITWGDCDPANIVYTGRMPWLALDAINGWWEAQQGHGWYQMEVDDNVGTPFVRLEMDLKRPVTPRHRLKCYVWPARLGETSIDFRVDGEQDGKLCWSFKATCVFIVADEFRKQPPPLTIREMVEAKLPKSA